MISGFSQSKEDVQIRTEQIADGVYFMESINGFGGGNMTVSVGEEGVLLVDNMYDWMFGKIKNALNQITNKEIRIAINSHFHTDHSGANKSLKDQAILIGHENVYQRFWTYGAKNVEALELLPTITFDDELSIRFNDEKIRMIHYPNSHTDGDVIVFFEKSKVLHLGDIYFNGMFPAVYASSGGNIKNLILSLEDIINRFPEDTRIVPGHGKVSSMNELEQYLKMLKTSVSIVEKGILEGRTLEDLKTNKVLNAYDDLGEGGGQSTSEFLSMVYTLLSE
nr:MBL fold metallo-hydrolase [Allomuricauda sp.]